MLVQSLSHTIVIFSLYFHFNRPPPPRLWTVPLLSYCNSIIKSVNSLRYELSISRGMSQKSMCSLLPCHSVSPRRFVPDKAEVDGSDRLSRKDSACVGCFKNFSPLLCCTRRVAGYVMAKRIPCSRSNFFTFPKACLFHYDGRGKIFKDRYVVAFVDQLTRGSRCLHDACLVLKIM